MCRNCCTCSNSYFCHSAFSKRVCQFYLPFPVSVSVLDTVSSSDSFDIF